MSATLTLNAFSLPLRALWLLSMNFGHLPAPCVDVTTVYPDVLQLRFHDDMSAFEAWRDALGITPDSVDCGEQSAGRTRVLKASVDFAGAVLELTGYGDVHAVAEAGAA